MDLRNTWGGHWLKWATVDELCVNLYTMFMKPAYFIVYQHRQADAILYW